MSIAMRERFVGIACAAAVFVWIASAIPAGAQQGPPPDCDEHSNPRSATRASKRGCKRPEPRTRAFALVARGSWPLRFATISSTRKRASRACCPVRCDAQADWRRRREHADLRPLALPREGAHGQHARDARGSPGVPDPELTQSARAALRASRARSRRRRRPCPSRASNRGPGAPAAESATAASRRTGRPHPTWPRRRVPVRPNTA